MSIRLDEISENIIPKSLQKKSIRLDQIKEDIAEKTSAKKVTDYFYPSFMTGMKPEIKDGVETQNIYGDIYNRPGAAVRSTLLGKGFTEGAKRPSEVPTYQDILKTSPQAQIVSSALIPGGVSGVAGTMDTITNPADILTLLLGTSPTIQKGVSEAGQIISKRGISPVVKKGGEFIEKTKPIINKSILGAKQIGKNIAEKRPRIMTQKYVKPRAETISKELENLKGLIGGEKEKAIQAAGQTVVNFEPNPNVVSKIQTKLKDPLYKEGIGLNIDEMGKFPTNVENIDKYKQAISDFMSTKEWDETSDIVKNALKKEYGRASEALKTAAPEAVGDIEGYHQFMKRYPTAKKVVTNARGEIIEKPLRGVFKKGAEQTTKESLEELGKMSDPLAQALKDVKKFTGRQSLKRGIGKAAIYGGLPSMALWYLLRGRK